MTETDGEKEIRKSMLSARLDAAADDDNDDDDVIYNCLKRLTSALRDSTSNKMPQTNQPTIQPSNIKTKTTAYLSAHRNQIFSACTNIAIIISQFVCNSIEYCLDNQLIVKT